MSVHQKELLQSFQSTHTKAGQNLFGLSDANIGGEIGIHGVPDNMDMLIDLQQNWTLGCISLKTKDVNEIYPYINNNTKWGIRSSPVVFLSKK